MRDIRRLIEIARAGSKDDVDELDRIIKRLEARMSNAARFDACLACNTPVFDNYMVRDEVWLSVFPEKGIAHLACLERVLQRDLRIEDFLTVPVNQGIIFGYMMGKKG